ncbi:hypothetical protein ACXHQJ_18790 [Vibrio vulnificus]|uniref:hypothetical protein n=1 Tax=Vibrio vulnificus TaxID=672 RepID=UPI000A7691F1|nr:hypothetical protein [Vibrio vulnificus]HDY7887123.1 hypothetical protein [Vibrio vulnificus]
MSKTNLPLGAEYIDSKGEQRFVLVEGEEHWTPEQWAQELIRFDAQQMKRAQALRRA